MFCLLGLTVCSLLPSKALDILFCVMGFNSLQIPMVSLFNIQSYHDILLPKIKATKFGVDCSSNTFQYKIFWS